MGELTEFFTSGGEVWFRRGGDFLPLTESSPVVSFLVERVRELYPDAYKALCACYEKSKANKVYFDYLVARRFCKCNFGPLDHTKKDVDGRVFHFERVHCPLQGECLHEGVICEPVMNTKLTEAEKRVMRLVVDGKCNQEIAEELYLSPNTVKRHISVSYVKTGSRNRADFVSYAKENSIFE